MVGYGCAVVVGDGQSAFLVDQIADEWRVENKILWADFVAGHSLGERCDFGGGEGGVPDADFGDKTKAAQGLADFEDYFGHRPRADNRRANNANRPHRVKAWI